MRRDIDPRKLLASVGAILEGEFFVAFKSGRVGTTYVNVDPLFTNPRYVSLLGEMLIHPFEHKASAVIGPAVGGIPLVFAAAGHSRLNSVQTAWADKQADGTFVISRMGFKGIARHQNVLIVEDITTTGESAKAVGKLVHDLGGRVIGYSFIWNRGSVTEEEMGAPIHSLINDPIPSWEPGQHPKWGAWPLVTDVGHSDKFADYPGPRIELLAA